MQNRRVAPEMSNFDKRKTLIRKNKQVFKGFYVRSLDEPKRSQ